MISNQKNDSNKSAIVIGASMAGLLGARVLADYFDKVTLIEKDTFPVSGENRKGVPQGKHVHVLLDFGRRIIERFLPGISAELIRQGACNIEDASRDVLWYHTDFHKHGISDAKVIGVSRPTLETEVRTRVLSLPNVEVMENCSISGLNTGANNGRITGVSFINSKTDDENKMRADLVLDAAGRGSHTPAWLENLGYQSPPEEKVKIGLVYSTCFYNRKPEDLFGYKGILFFGTPERKRFGVLIGQDGNRWVATMGGVLGNDPPSEYQEFLKFAKELPSPFIYNLIKDEEPLSRPVVYKFPASLRRHYEKLSRFPEGYIVLGDALCSFNPVYGQGMTLAAMEAEALGECLANGEEQLAKRYFEKACKLIDVPWNLSVGSDLMYPEVEGKRTPVTRFFNWYINKLHIAAQKDSEVSAAFMNMINMNAKPTSILRPRIVWRIMKGNFL